MPVVNTFSGCPGGSPDDKTINWITCPWPPEFTTGLNYQWNDVAIPYWQEAAPFAVDHGIKVALEMHPGMMVYNVYTLLRLREAIGPVIGANFDPSHLFWNGVDPVAAIRKLGSVAGGNGGAIFHMHGKDVYVDPFNIAVNGCNDNKPYTQISDRSWTFRSIGYGHGTSVWKDIVERAAHGWIRLRHLHRARRRDDVERRGAREGHLGPEGGADLRAGRGNVLGLRNALK